MSTPLPANTPYSAGIRWLRRRWRETKRLIEYLGYALHDRVAVAGARRGQALPQRSTPAAVLLQLGLLGDYVLWRPYGLALAQHLRDQGLRPVLVCNALYQVLAERDFAGCEVWALELPRWNRDLAYRRERLLAMRQLGAKRAHHMGYPRYGITDDAVIRALGAETMGFSAIAIDRSRLEGWLSRGLYHRLLPAQLGRHQIERYRHYLRAAGATSPTEPLHVSANNGREPSGQHALSGRPYYLLAPGASSSGRRWPEGNFIELAQRVQAARPDWLCVLIGTAGERELAERIADALDAVRVRVLAGSTAVTDLPPLIAGARLVLANDSAAAHLAAAEGTPCLAIVGGGHFGQFLPYPDTRQSVRRKPDVAARPMPCFNCEWDCVYQLPPEQAFPCVSAVPVEQVWQQLQALMAEAPP